MNSTEEHWAAGTPERALADCFSAFRRRDVARIAGGATSDSIRALAARVRHDLDARDAGTSFNEAGELTDSDSASILSRVVTRLPDVFTHSLRCLIVGHVLESPDVALVVFRVAHQFPGQGIVPMPDPQVATTRLVSGEWKLVLDEWSDVGLPGLRGFGFWIDESPTAEAATAD